MKSTNLLMIAASDRDADMLYATGLFAPDPFIYLRLRGRDYIVMSDLEIDRARRQSPHCHVLSLSRYEAASRRSGVRRPSLADIVAAIARERNTGLLFVPAHFPLALADELRRRRVRVKARRGGFFPTREIKAAAEIKKISAALAMAEVGLAEGIQALRHSRIGRDRRLLYRNAPLTSERLRGVIDTAILQTGGLPSHTIVAGGLQACDPHERGHGPLRAHEPIILDIFPRSQETGYFGDITRTVVRGRATEGVRRLYDTVHRGQLIAHRQIRAGVSGRLVHRTVERYFEHAGYKTERRAGRMQGFFHGTGHGFGLEIHEAPRLGPTSTDTLRAGHVVTVEPGLYYPGLGGVRIEDDVVVTAKGARNLTRFEKVLEV